jgi:signal transduction histidine kinase
MRWQIAEYQKHSEMHFEFESPDPDLAIDRATALVLFRIFQETITNVARHARATEVHVALTSSETSLVLRIHDNGVGIAPADVMRPTAHGIRGMRERALQIGGTLVVTGEPAEGTTVVVTVPRHLSEKRADERASERADERASS